LVLAGEHRREVEAEVADLDAVTTEAFLGQMIQLAGVEQRLTRDAADVEARPAQGRALLDAGYLHPELRRPDRRHVAAGPGADHNQIVIVGHRRTRRGENLSADDADKIIIYKILSALICVICGWISIYIPSINRSGFSTPSLTLTRKLTA